MEWEKAIKKNENLIEIPLSWLFVHYYEALTVLFRIENALRVFVFIILKNEFGEKWVDTKVPGDGSSQDTIKSIARKRISQAKSFGYLGYSINCPVMHLTVGELICLIDLDVNWPHFKKYFSGSKEIIKNKFDEIANVRNSLAHFRPIKEDDVEVVKQNAKHVLTEIERCISDIIGCRNVVPTNTTEQWYKELKTLGTDNCMLSFSQSGDEQWVKINIQYNCPIIFHDIRRKSYIIYRILNIISSAILKEYPVLSKFITYLSEDVPYIEMGKDLEPNFRKIIILVFSQKMLREHHEELKHEIEKILLKISEETELIKQDNLARGKIVEAVDSSAMLRGPEGKKYWYIRKHNFTCDVMEDDPPEFWGSFDVDTPDFISETHKYPWMPVEISEVEEIPF